MALISTFECKLNKLNKFKCLFSQVQSPSPFREILICFHISCGARGLLYFWQPLSRKGAISPFLQPLHAREITTVSDWSLTQPQSLTQTIRIIFAYALPIQHIFKIECSFKICSHDIFWIMVLFWICQWIFWVSKIGLWTSRSQIRCQGAR